MPDGNRPFDVAIVGASLAGCAAALFFARRDLTVALVERSPDPDHYKAVCTHYLQPSAVPTLDRLGLCASLERAGAVRNAVAIWTRWGWIHPPDGPERPHGYNLRRQVLDPLVRRAAVSARGVEYFGGHSARALVERDGRVCGVEVESGRVTRTLHARLVVAADGRYSRVAALAGVPTTAQPNSRSVYFATYEGIELATGSTSQMWLLEPDVVYAFPNDHGSTVLAWMYDQARAADYRHAPERHLLSRIKALPDAPDLGRAVRVSPLGGMIDVTSISRAAARPGLALVGDAALASDPLWGVGCGWAFQTAEWLADSVGDAVAEADAAGIDRALARYARVHQQRLAPHHAIISDFSTGRPYNLIERLFFPASTRDAKTARHFDAFGSRLISPREFLNPAAIARAAWVNLRHRPRPLPIPAALATHRPQQSESGAA